VNREPILPVGDDVKLVILDCDGVLFDSWHANVAFYDSVLATIDHGPLDETGRQLCHRLSGPQLWAHLFANDPVLRERAKAAATRADYARFYPLMRPTPLLTETLQRLSAHCPLALATNRGRTVAGVTRHFSLDRFFAIALGILDVARPKPAPDLLIACLERTGIGAESAVFVGDTLVDKEAATAAGVAYVGVGTESGSDRSINELRELPEYLGIPPYGASRKLNAP
jgi:HAD superfamily hydrolase (TIGR01509 family)